MNSKFLLICIIFSIWGSPTFLYAQTLHINEIMTDNDDFLSDKDGDFSDWIEIYNASNQDINLLNYQLSDDETELDKWIFPSITIPPNGFLLVFASNKDDHNITELHSNFKISKSGETIVLSNPNNEIISKVTVPVILSNYAYGSVSDGTTDYISFKIPSPNASNAFSSGVYASHPSGFYSDPFDLILKSSDPNQKIYYSINGNEPTSSDHLFNGTLRIIKNICEYSLACDHPYSNIPTTPLSGPARLYEYIWKEPQTLYTTNVIRYASFSGDTMKSQVYTKTFFVDPEIEDRYQFPIIMLATDSLNLFDYETGIYIPGKRFDEQGFGHFPYGNYLNTGIEWERKAHLTFLENNGTIAFETDVGIRIRGGGSTANPQKSFNLYFRNDYGLKEVDYPVFQENINTSFKRLVLRNSGNDFPNTHFRDAIQQHLIAPLGLDLQRFRPSVVFINGEYWGIHNIREKYDKFYFEYNFGVEADNLNIVDFNGVMEDGSNVEYLALLNYVETKDMTQDVHYEHVKERVDIDNFMDYLIAEIYFANYDWPCNNYKVWKTNDPGSKWRFLIYDLDFSFGLIKDAQYDAPSVAHALSDESGWPHCPNSNALFRGLIKHEGFKTAFIERFSHHLNTVLHIDTVLTQINNFEKLFFPEMQEHMERWNYPSNFEEWYNEIDIMKYFAINRPCFLREHLMDFFQLTDIGFECPDFASYDRTASFQIFPNPSNGTFTIRTNSLIPTIGNIKLINVKGQTVFTKENVIVNDKNRINIDLRSAQELTNGVYFLYFENKTINFIEKVVIIKD